jgi:hypothetical protein
MESGSQPYQKNSCYTRGFKCPNDELEVEDRVLPFLQGVLQPFLFAPRSFLFETESQLSRHAYDVSRTI